MAVISRESIENILESANIEEVIGEFVTLRKRGSNLVGLCPFHNEKTPSFSVSPSKGIYKCFGCGKAGNVVNFIMDHEHYTYPEALRFLAAKYHIELIEDERSDEDEALRDQRESLYHLNQYALRFFRHHLLEDPKGKAIALTYLEERHFRDDIIELFQLGYSPDLWDIFTTTALNEGYKAEQLVKSGLTIEKEGKLYDRFRGRIIFPIHNLTGNIVGFGGRIMKNDKNIPKYVNSPESEIYNKSKVLYGLFQSKGGISDKKECLLVEGYTDVLSLHQAGISNVVASSGTSLTVDQIKLIKRYTSDVTILYDGDEAGLKASFRGIDLILEQGMNVRIVMFPEGEDPDSFARERSRNEVREFVASTARNFILFKTGLLMKEASSDPIRRASMIKELVGSIALIPDSISRSAHIRECSQQTGMSEAILVTEMNKILRQKHTGQYIDLDARIEDKSGVQVQLTPPDANDSTYQELNLLRILLNHGQKDFQIEKSDEKDRKILLEINTAEFIIRDLERDEIGFSKALFVRFYNAFVEAWKKEGKAPDIKYFINHEDGEISGLAIDLSSSQYNISSNWAERHRIYISTEEEVLKELVFESIYSFKLKKIEQLLSDISKQIRDSSDETQVMKLMKTQNELLARKKFISHELGRIITR